MRENALIYSAEDDASIRELLECTMEASGFRVRVFETAEELLAAMREKQPDLVLLDIMLPGMDGIEALREIKGTYRGIPVILVSAKGSELNKVKGLEAGADDYIAKPFGVLELIARIKTRLRTETSDSLSLRGICINFRNREVAANGERVSLTVKEYELLCALMKDAGKVLKRDELLNRVWGYDYMGETRTLDMHVMSLRGKLGDSMEEGEYRYISTVRGVGYLFRENEV